MIKKDKILNVNVFDADDGYQYIRFDDFIKAMKRVIEVKDKEHNKINEVYILLKNEVHLCELYNAHKILELLSEVLNNE